MEKEPEWTTKLEEWGTNTEIEDLEYAHKKEVSYNKKCQKIKRTTEKTETHTAT